MAENSSLDVETCASGPEVSRSDPARGFDRRGRSAGLSVRPGRSEELPAQVAAAAAVKSMLNMITIVKHLLFNGVIDVKLFNS